MDDFVTKSDCLEATSNLLREVQMLHTKTLDVLKETNQDIRDLRVSIQGDNLGNAGIIPTVQNTVIKVQELNSYAHKFRARLDLTEERLQKMEGGHKEILSKLDDVNKFKWYVLGAAGAITTFLGIILT